MPLRSEAQVVIKKEPLSLTASLGVLIRTAGPIPSQICAQSSLPLNFLTFLLPETGMTSYPEAALYPGGHTLLVSLLFRPQAPPARAVGRALLSQKNTVQVYGDVIGSNLRFSLNFLMMPLSDFRSQL